MNQKAVNLLIENATATLIMSGHTVLTPELVATATGNAVIDEQEVILSFVGACARKLTLDGLPVFAHPVTDQYLGAWKMFRKDDTALLACSNPGDTHAWVAIGRGDSKKKAAAAIRIVTDPGDPLHQRYLTGSRLPSTIGTVNKYLGAGGNGMDVLSGVTQKYSELAAAEPSQGELLPKEGS